MDRVQRVLLFGAGVAMLMLALGRERQSPVRYFRPNPLNRVDGSRTTREARMARALTSLQIARKRFPGLGPRIAAFASTVTAEQARALRASDQAALHRRRLAELRAMYVRPPDR
jgi:hypothetical protein